jgi:hypothetical protein
LKYRGRTVGVFVTGDEVALAHREAYLQMLACGEAVGANEVVSIFCSYIRSELDFEMGPFIERAQVDTATGTPAGMLRPIIFNQSKLVEGDVLWRQGDRVGARKLWRSHVDHCEIVRSQLPKEGGIKETFHIDILQSQGLALEKLGDFDDAIVCHDTALTHAERERSVSLSVERQIRLQELMTASAFRKTRVLISKSRLTRKAISPYEIAMTVEAGRSRLFKEGVGVGPGPAQGAILEAALQQVAAQPVWFVMLPSTAGCIEGWYILAPGLGPELFRLGGSLDSVSEAVEDLERLGRIDGMSLDQSTRRQVLDHASHLLFPDEFFTAAITQHALVLSAELYLLDAPLAGLWRYRCMQEGSESVSVFAPSIAACRLEPERHMEDGHPTVVADPGGEFGITPEQLGLDRVNADRARIVDRELFTALWRSADSLLFLGHHAIDRARPRHQARTAGSLELADEWLDVDTLLTGGHTPRTVVLISCSAGQQHATATLGRAREPAGTAIAIMKNGTRSVIASPNPVRVDVGLNFARHYLQAAAYARHPVFACEAARQAIWDSYGCVSDQGLGALMFTCMTTVLWPRENRKPMAE